MLKIWVFGARHTFRLLCFIACIMAPAASAQVYPTQPIRLVIPFAAGGGTDVTARSLAAELGKELGQTVVPENRPGAAGNIAASQVVDSRADGYTLLFGASVIATNVAFGPVPTFEPTKALAPISLVAKAPFLVAVDSNLGIKSVHELVAAARANPDKLSIGAAQLDVYVKAFTLQTGIELIFVPYKGGSAAMQDLLGGRISMMYAQAPVLLPYLRSGRLTAIGVSSDKRLDILPDVPTFTETGESQHRVTYWYGLFAPAGTPPEVVERLSKATKKVMTQTKIAEDLRSIGIEPVASDPEELGALLRSEIAFWMRAKDKIEPPASKN